MDTVDNLRIGVSFSGIPDSDGGEDEDGEEEEELFEAADNLDLGAVDLCVSTRQLYLKSFCVGSLFPCPPGQSALGAARERALFVSPQLFEGFGLAEVLVR